MQMSTPQQAGIMDCFGYVFFSPFGHCTTILCGIRIVTFYLLMRKAMERFISTQSLYHSIIVYLNRHMYGDLASNYYWKV